MASPIVIVFGPTGDVGSSVARTAASLGANVVLAMRDTTKPIPGVDSKQEEASGQFRRIHADLMQPDSVRQAVAQTKAEKAFFYLAFGSDDNMKSTIVALKEAGIKQVVFLSSYCVRGPVRDIPPEQLVPYVHAQVEANLEEVFGADGFYVLRPGAFAKNILMYLQGVKSGRVQVLSPDMTFDWIVPDDIGRVGGTVLVKGTPDGNRLLFLYGPQITTRSDLIKTLAKALDKEYVLEPTDEEGEYDMLIKTLGYPPAAARYQAERDAGEGHDDAPLKTWGFGVTEDELNNVEKYSGTKGTTVEEWIERIKGNL